jgi:hypothetical protein
MIVCTATVESQTLHLDPERPVFMLRAYFDDAGADEQAVADYVASVDACSRLDASWASVLDFFHVEWFHAKDFERSPRLSSE